MSTGQSNLQMECGCKQFARLLGTYCVAFILLAAGCGPGGPEIARVEGTVRLDGKPLARAIVVFVPVGGRPSAANADENGHYLLEFSGGRKGAIPGLNRVEITTFMPGGYDDDGKAIPGTKEMVPAQYNRNTTLEFDVIPGKRNVANFDLESKGKIVVDGNSY